MKESFTRRDLWDIAGKGGLVLGMVSIVYILIGQLVMKDAISKIGVWPAKLIDIALWIAKFVGCILLMKMYMRRFASTYAGVTHRDAGNLGIAIALTSALVYSGFYLAFAKFIQPEMFSEALDTAMESYSSMMDSNALDAIENLKGSMPTIAFFTNLIYCFIYGSVLSSILSHNIGEDINPFSDTQND